MRVGQIRKSLIKWWSFSNMSSSAGLNAARRFGWDIALEQSRSIRCEKASSCDEAFSNMAPPAGLEPATYGLTVRRSTNWTKGELLVSTSGLLRPLFVKYQIMVPRGGIEPPTRGFSILCSTDWAIEAKEWCRLPESNWWPTDYKSVALPTELSRHTKFFWLFVI